MPLEIEDTINLTFIINDKSIYHLQKNTGKCLISKSGQNLPDSTKKFGTEALKTALKG